MTKNTIKIMTTIQAIMLSAYGFCAILLHRNMMSYDIYSVGNSGSPVHICYLITVILGLFLVIRGIVKDRKLDGYFRSAEFLTPAAVTLLCVIFSQANTVYTSTSGGSLGGFLGYMVRSALSGSDPIDSFVYGSMTIPKYLFVVAAGFVAAIFTIIRKPADNVAEPAKAVGTVNTEIIKAHAVAAVEDGSRMINRAVTVAGAAMTAAREAAIEAASTKQTEDAESPDSQISEADI